MPDRSAAGQEGPGAWVGKRAGPGLGGSAEEHRVLSNSGRLTTTSRPMAPAVVNDLLLRPV